MAAKEGGRATARQPGRKLETTKEVQHYILSYMENSDEGLCSYMLAIAMEDISGLDVYEDEEE